MVTVGFGSATDMFASTERVMLSVQRWLVASSLLILADHFHRRSSANHRCARFTERHHYN